MIISYCANQQKIENLKCVYIIIISEDIDVQGFPKGSVYYLHTDNRFYWNFWYCGSLQPREYKKLDSAVKAANNHKRKGYYTSVIAVPVGTPIKNGTPVYTTKKFKTVAQKSN